MSSHVYPNPQVRRVDDGSTQRIEPSLEDSWSDGQKLAWKAAVIEMDTGLTIRILDGQSATRRRGRWVPDTNVYAMTISGPGGGSGHSPASFHACWNFLNGVNAGASTATLKETP